MNQARPAVDDAASQRLALRLSEIRHFFETLNPEKLDQLALLYSAQARFKDPFQSVQGLDAIRAVFEHMFRVQPSSRFVVLSIVQSQAAPFADPPVANLGGEQALQAQCCLRWQYWLELAGKPACIEGCSWLILDEEGKIAEHRDYWDAAEELYEKIPLLRWLMRWLRRKIASG